MLGEGKMVLDHVYKVFKGKKSIKSDIFLKYNETRHLNLSNLQQITAEKVGFS